MKKIGIIVIIWLITSCSMMENYTVNDKLEEFYFNETMVEIYVGGLGYANITVFPRSILDSENIKYESSNNEVIAIREGNNNGIEFYGKAEGVAVITATIKEEETKIAVTVLSLGIIKDAKHGKIK